MHRSADELITFFQSDLMLDFGFDDDYVIQSLGISMQELHRMKLGLPAPPRPSDAQEKPTKPFGSFEPPSIEQLIASMQIETTGREFVGRPSIPPDGGPAIAIVPEALLKRNASDWSFLDRENDDVSSVHPSVAASNCPSSRTSLVSSLLDNIGSLSSPNEPGVVSFPPADDCAPTSRMMLTARSADVDQMSNYDNVPMNGCDEISSVNEQELDQTLESIDREIQELLGSRTNSSDRSVTISTAFVHSDHSSMPSDNVSTPVIGAQQQNHILSSYAGHSPGTESSTELDSVLTNSSLTPEVHSGAAEHHAALPSPSTAVSNATNSAPPISWSDNNLFQPCQKTVDVTVIPIQHLPSTAKCPPPPVKPKPKKLVVSPSSKSQLSESALTPIPVMHLRTVPVAQFSNISSLSTVNRQMSTSSTDGC